MYGSTSAQVVGEEIGGWSIAKRGQIFFWRMEIALLKSVGLD
jgi:hypothetical protein